MLCTSGGELRFVDCRDPDLQSEGTGIAIHMTRLCYVHLALSSGM